MTDTPERIALRWQPGVAVTNGPLMDHPDYTQWVRADVAAAMVAAEREACARAVEAEALEAPSDSDGDQAYDAAIRHAVAAIRKRGQQ
jgi:hypothetical protein